jgi:hypothetical protein
MRALKQMHNGEAKLQPRKASTVKVSDTTMLNEE